MSADETKPRKVEPYGLAFLGAHWYLVARDREHGKLRSYRLSRMALVTPNRARAQSADYDIPATFSLESHARSRDAWHLGEDAIIEAVVEFRGSSGAVRQGMKLGGAVRGSPGQRRFQIRRPDTFVRAGPGLHPSWRNLEDSLRRFDADDLDEKRLAAAITRSEAIVGHALGETTAE